MGKTTSNKHVPGEPLMCIWQTAYVKDPRPKSYMKKEALRAVLKDLDGTTGLSYNDRSFQKEFKESKTFIELNLRSRRILRCNVPKNNRNSFNHKCKQGRYQGYFRVGKVDYLKFKNYVETKLLNHSVPMPMVLNAIEVSCWNSPKHAYHCDILNDQDIFKLWATFNRMSDCGSYPPVISKHQIQYLIEKVTRYIDKIWKRKEPLPAKGWTFQDLLNNLANGPFYDTNSAVVKQCIADLHSWLVQEIMKTGWLYICTFHEESRISWKKQWFVMTPGQLLYYNTDDNTREKMGNIVLDNEVVVDDIDIDKSLLTKMQHRFKIISGTGTIAELCTDTKEEKVSWLTNFRENIIAIKTGITPQMKLLKERARLTAKFSSVFETLIHIDSKLQDAESEAMKRSIEDPITKPDEEKNVKEDGNSKSGVNVFDVEKDKIKKVFIQIDTDDNGRIDRDEFAVFMNDLGLKLDTREINLIFDMIDKDDNKFIYFEEFVDYYVSFVLGQSDDSLTEGKLRSAFLQADRDGSGAVSFKEFSEYVYSTQRSAALDKLMASMNLGDDDEIQFDDFKKFLGDDPTMKENKTSSKDSSQDIEGLLEKIYVDTDVSDISTYLQSRWKKFASFKRYGEKGDLVMTGSDEIVEDVVPGQYQLLDLACFNDLPPIEPKHVVIKGVKWMKSEVSGKSGKAYFPSDFDGNIPMEIATNGHLGYYGASLCDGNQTKISLFYRHGIQDFTYENDYLESYVKSDVVHGGVGIEKHEFAHLDCPLDDNSGVFIIGKFEGENLHLTGFKVPTRHSIYVPGGTVHSNDYLKGTWRTMLSDEAEIDHVLLVKKDDNSNTEKSKGEQFTFLFTPLSP